DVRAVFEQISKIAQEIVPHDYFSLGLLNEDGTRVRIHASFGADRLAAKEVEYSVPDVERPFREWDHYLARDHTLLDGRTVRAHPVHRDPSRPTTVDQQLDEEWLRIYTDLGVRSTLRAPVRLNGVVVGAIDFSSRQPDLYGEEETEFAVRVAEHVSLALTHRQLAEEARRTEAARSRAAHLQERVSVLVQELETLSPHRALGRS